MKLVKVPLVVFFLFLLLVKLYFKMQDDYHAQPFFYGTVLLTSFIAIFLYPSKATWCTGMALFSYGLYYYFSRAVLVAEPGVMDFTYPLRWLLFTDSSQSVGYRILNLFPFVFYVASIIVFLTKPLRRLYFTANKVAKFTL